MNPYAPMFAEIEKSLDHALSLDPKTDLEAILVHVRIARSLTQQMRMIDGLFSQHFETKENRT